MSLAKGYSGVFGTGKLYSPSDHAAIKRVNDERVQVLKKLRSLETALGLMADEAWHIKDDGVQAMFLNPIRSTLKRLVPIIETYNKEW